MLPYLRHKTNVCLVELCVNNGNFRREGKSMRRERRAIGQLDLFDLGQLTTFGAYEGYLTPTGKPIGEKEKKKSGKERVSRVKNQKGSKDA